MIQLLAVSQLAASRQMPRYMYSFLLPRKTKLLCQFFLLLERLLRSLDHRSPFIRVSLKDTSDGHANEDKNEKTRNVRCYVRRFVHRC